MRICRKLWRQLPCFSRYRRTFAAREQWQPAVEPHGVTRSPADTAR